VGLHAAHVSYRRNWGTDLIAGSATNDAEVIVTNSSAKLQDTVTLRPARETIKLQATDSIAQFSGHGTSTHVRIFVLMARCPPA
jgi:hypothetical protein